MYSGRKALEKREQEKLYGVLQYVMLVTVLVLALVLPAYGAKWQSKESAADGAGSLRKEAQGKEDNRGGTAKQAIRGTIVLDAGHGGADSGMTGASGVEEKDLNLIYVKKLEKLLEEAGFEVVLTRKNDDGLYSEGVSNKKAQDMQRRCAVIEEAEPLLTVSIHQNSYPQDASVSGPQVFYYGKSEDGRQLAECIQQCMNEQLAPERPRSAKGNETYYILKRSAGTTVIVECGFLTNPQEEVRLQEESYQDHVVQAVCDGILQYCRKENGLQP